MTSPERSTVPTAWHASELRDLAAKLGTDLDAGLAADEAVRRQQREGFNELPEVAGVSWLRLLLSQFTSIIIWVLIGAAVLSGLLRDWLDAAAIFAIVLLNGILGFTQEYRAERSLAALRKMSVAMARVVRGGVPLALPARELVPGDVILLEAGDRVPADARLVYASHFQAQEASLTGESTPVQKGCAVLPSAEVPLADRTNMVFMGTVAVSGKARAVVVATGSATELGRIASMIRQAAEAERSETPLQRRLERFGYTLLWLALGVVAIVFGLGYLRGEPLVDMFLIAVSLAVAAVPEGLPAVVTITLALGVTRMVQRNALIRKLPAVEALGSATVICTDKTGTLTKNEMTVTHLITDGHVFAVTGEGYAPEGSIKQAEAQVEGQVQQASRGTEGPASGLPPAVLRLLTAAVLCNGAELRREGDRWVVLGDPTEGALLVAAAKAGLTKDTLECAAPFQQEIPFDAERKMMTIVCRTPSGAVAYSKGAPDVLLKRCVSRLTLEGRIEALDEADRQRIAAANHWLAQQALRVLAVAEHPLEGPALPPDEEIESQLVFLGLVAMKDPLRPEAIEAVRLCHGAGIRTTMITGDHQDTAVAIARELGLARHDAAALAGAELDRLTDGDLADRIERVSVFARVSAEHKLRIVQAWKRKGAVVAMTGDGVNDAPAIKAADIGVAMGITGTDVTKEASDMVVMDDNFASIAAAVEEGRAILDNIRKTVHFLLSCNVSEVLVMFFAALFGLPLPLLPIQILWMNLVTDGIPALALAVDPKAPDLMTRPPRRPDEPLMDRSRLLSIGSEGLLLASIALAAFVVSLFVWQQSLEQARTVTFTVMVLAQLVHAFNSRSERLSLWQLGLVSNRPLVWAFVASLGVHLVILTMPAAAPIFKVAPLPLEDWELMIVMGGLPLLLMEAIKAIRRLR